MPGLRVVLVSPRNPLNIGAVARAMSNFGYSDLQLVKPYDVAFREAVSAVKSGYILERACVHDSLGEALAGCTMVVGTTSVGNRDLHVPLYTLETAGATLRREAASSQVALVFGSEKFGLSNEDISHCHWLLRIPARGEHGSMNLGQAVAICLYETIRDAAAPQELREPAPRADGEQVERITTLLYEVLTRSGYVQERTAESTLLKLRRLVLRAGLPANDAETWTGYFRHILWKLKQRRSDADDENQSSPEMPEQMPESGSR